MTLLEIERKNWVQVIKVGKRERESGSSLQSFSIDSWYTMSALCFSSALPLLPVLTIGAHMCGQINT